MILSQQWCVQQIPEGGYRCCRILGTKRGTIIFDKVIEMKSIKKNCKGKLFFSFTPEDYYLFTDQFPELKPELLDLQIKRRFADQGLSADPADLIHTSRKIPDKRSDYNAIFLPQKELLENLNQLSKMAGTTQCKLVPAAAAISGLIKTITDKAVLVLFTGTESSQVLIVKNGIPLYSQALAQTSSGGVEQELIPNAIDFARINVRKEHGVDQFEILVLGPLRDTIQLNSLGIEQWQPDFSSRIQTAEADDVYYYPHLFGAFFADSDYSFLPDSFSRIWKLQRISKSLAFCAIVGALLMFAGWLYCQPKITRLKTEYLYTLVEVEKQQQDITRKIPPQEDLNNIERLFEIRNNAEKDFRLDQLVTMLAEALPSEVFITDLIMKRQDRETSDTAMDPGAISDPVADPNDSSDSMMAESLSFPETLQPKPFTISLRCSSKGSYTDVTTRFKKAATALNNLFSVADYTWNYQEQNQTGILQCELTPGKGTDQ